MMEDTSYYAIIKKFGISAKLQMADLNGKYADILRKDKADLTDDEKAFLRIAEKYFG